MHNLFRPCWKIKYSLFPDLLTFSVWREDLPVLDNLTQSHHKSIKYIHFRQIQLVKVSRLNHILSIENAKKAIHLQLGWTILLILTILIFILNSYSFIWKTLASLKFHLKSIWCYYIKICGSHRGGREDFSLAQMAIILHYVKSQRYSSISARF